MARPHPSAITQALVPWSLRERPSTSRSSRPWLSAPSLRACVLMVGTAVGPVDERLAVGNATLLKQLGPARLDAFFGPADEQPFRQSPRAEFGRHAAPLGAVLMPRKNSRDRLPQVLRQCLTARPYLPDQQPPHHPGLLLENVTRASACHDRGMGRAIRLKRAEEYCTKVPDGIASSQNPIALRPERDLVASRFGLRLWSHTPKDGGSVERVQLRAREVCDGVEEWLDLRASICASASFTGSLRLVGVLCATQFPSPQTELNL